MGKTVPEVFRPRAVLKTEGRDRKIRAAKRTSQIAGFATVPSEKKKNLETFRSNHISSDNRSFWRRALRKNQSHKT